MKLLLEKTERKLKCPLGAPRITEQPRRLGSSAGYIRYPMTQGYRPGEACRSFLTLLLGRTVITLETPPVTHGPRASSV